MIGVIVFIIIFIMIGFFQMKRDQQSTHQSQIKIFYYCESCGYCQNKIFQKCPKCDETQQIFEYTLFSNQSDEKIIRFIQEQHDQYIQEHYDKNNDQTQLVENNEDDDKTKTIDNLKKFNNQLKLPSPETHIDSIEFNKGIINIEIDNALEKRDFEKVKKLIEKKKKLENE